MADRVRDRDLDEHDAEGPKHLRSPPADDDHASGHPGAAPLFGESPDRDESIGHGGGTYSQQDYGSSARRSQWRSERQDSGAPPKEGQTGYSGFTEATPRPAGTSIPSSTSGVGVA